MTTFSFSSRNFKRTPLWEGAGFRCPSCANNGCDVKDSRPRDDGQFRRRRQCKVCKHRFTTLEIVVSDEEIVQRELVNRMIPKFLKLLREASALLTPFEPE